MSDPGSTILSLCHFEPLAELAIQRYSMNVDGIVINEPQDECAVKFVLAVMELYDRPDRFNPSDFESFSLQTLLEYLERTHCFYEAVMLPKMEQVIEALCNNFPESSLCSLLDSFFKAYRTELVRHIRQEECELFPYARRLSHGGRITDYSTNDFEHGHSQEIEVALKRIIEVIEANHKDLTDAFAYRSFKTLLLQFETDLSIHHKIEEHVFLSKLRLLEEDHGGFPFQ